MQRIIVFGAIILSLLLWQRLMLYPSAIVGEELNIPAATKADIILLPLDSRPPCREFVVKIGRIAGVNVITPPHELMDYYSYPGETEKLKSWLEKNAVNKKAIILSTDQLLCGGLLAAREKCPTEEECNRLLEFLRKLKMANPAVPVYAFSVLPRFVPPDSIDGFYERRALTEYSRLMGRLSAGFIVDKARLAALKEHITPENLAKYEAQFTRSRKLSEALSVLVQEGVLSGLVLGQDDGEPYSIGNIEKEKLLAFLSSQGIASDKVFLIHGADEIAQLMLAKIIRGERKGNVCVEYNTPTTPAKIMPFMAVDLRRVVEERLTFLGLEQTKEPGAADFVLAVAATDQNTGDLDGRAPLMRKMRAWQGQNVPVALVDLSRHFRQRETILPLLIRQNYPMNTLASYSGWNTAGNAVGTAIAESLVYITAKGGAIWRDEYASVIARNQNFVTDRILEDNYYLKDVIDVVNNNLKCAGYVNTADLDLEHNYLWANNMLRQSMGRRIDAYRASPSFRVPTKDISPHGDITLQTASIATDMSFPWPRTFEINLSSYISVVRVTN